MHCARPGCRPSSGLEILFAAVFSVEYVFRIWSAAEGPRSRLRYALMPSSLIDLVVVLASLLPFIGTDVRILRLLRVVRMLRIAKLGRFSRAFGTLERGAPLARQRTCWSPSRWRSSC